MAITINYPKNPPLKPLFILLVIVLAPFALFFSLVRIPFAKRRVVKLNEIIADDWIPRHKYVYISWSEDFELADFAQHTVARFKPNVIFDKWSSTEGEWEANEPDTYNRVTAFLQDICNEFDGKPNLLVATVDPKHATFSTEGTNEILFYFPSKDGYVSLWGDDVPFDEAKKQITEKIQACLKSWEKHEGARTPKEEMEEVNAKLAKIIEGMPKEIVQAHNHSSNHRKEILASKKCGCFYCLETFKPSEIKEWVDDGKCAICPRCGIDSVLGDAAGFPLTKEFLGSLHHYWFSETELRP